MRRLNLKPASFLFDKFKNLSLRKKIITSVVFLVTILFFGYRYYQFTKPSNYELATASFDSITEVVNETGNITTTGSVPIYSTTTGIVETMMVSNGDYVEKGDILFKVTSTATKQEKNAALSTYLAAKDAWETAKANQLSLQASMFTQWDQFKELAESDEYEEDDGRPRYDQRGLPEFHIPEKEWLASEALYKKQQITINQTAANKNAAWQAYQATQDSEVIAILDGEIKNLSVDKGDLVTVYNILTAATNPPSLVIFNSDVKTIIKVDIGETDVIKVAENQPTTIAFDAIPDQTFSGHVDRVDSLALPTSGVVKYSVYIILDEVVESIKAGMTADVDITVGTKENILTVPSNSIRPYEGGRAVRVVGKKDEIEFIPVKTGIKGDGKIEIISGIEEGTKIIVALKNQVEKKTGSGFF
ncbi:MAG: efflux RND transporter periplasmic adaptor subunit [Candidatus Pacebacteria bacterium]|nr:efflux RND transporter periplasmic adaptor subunit [Candidatus Paceibacterota bacterium]